MQRESRGFGDGDPARPAGAGRVAGRARRRTTIALCAMVMVAAVAAAALAAGAAAEQASEPLSPAAGEIDVSGGGGDGSGHSCAVLVDRNVRCWGFGGAGRLGYANTATIGDKETPAAAGPVNLGTGPTTVAVSAGAFHTCALLDDGGVRCWGFGGEGRLGYGNTEPIGDNEPPDTAGRVDLGGPAKAISAGGGHTCAILTDNSVRCWGFGSDGRLGHNKRGNIGDTESPASAGAVFLGTGRSAKAISAGESHTCALLDDGNVLCWGFAANGQLGQGAEGDPDADENAIGDNETPGSAGPVNLGGTATAISAGAGHTCALLDDGAVRCWGFGGNGRLGTATTTTIGDDESPASAGTVLLGESARAISAGDSHNCAILTDNSVRCWGFNPDGRLGLAHRSDVGDDESPASAGAVDLRSGAIAISAGGRHTCARLQDKSVRCWGVGAHGRLGYCNEVNVGDDEVPGAAGPVALGEPAVAGAGCAAASPPGPSLGGGGSPANTLEAQALRAQALRRRRLRSCLRRVTRHTSRETSALRRLSGARRARAKRHLARHRGQLRRRCLKRHARTPGRVTGLTARAVSRTQVALTFNAAGTHGSRPPAAREYLVKQSRRRLHSTRSFRRAQTLCAGSCRFPAITRVGGRITLTVRDLRPRTTYYYAVAARDNVSRRLGPRSRAVRVRTR